MTFIKFPGFLTRPGSILSPGIRYQLLATITANIVLFSHGIGVGWLSPTIAKFQSDDSPVTFFIGITEISWIGSLVGMGSLLGNILFGGLLDLIGRKPCLQILAIPQIILWILVYTAESVEYLYIGRFLGGITGGGGYCVVAIFISEIADTNIRGTLSSFLMLSVNLGILVGIIIGSYVPYNLIPCFVIVLPIFYTVAIMFFPESPIHLLKKNEVLRAENSMKFYKNFTSQTTNVPNFNEEFDTLRNTIAKSKIGGKVKPSDFVTRPALKASAVALVLLFVNQFSGTFAFVNYMSRIFEKSGSIVDSNVSSMIACGVQIIGATTAVFFVDRYGRKILLLISTSGLTIALVLFGMYTYFLQSHPGLNQFSWIPLVLMMCYVFIANIGIVALTIVVMVELFPAKLRSISVSCGMAVLSSFVFCMLKIFPIYLQNFGITVTMWSCAGVTFGGFVILLLFLKETKGKSMLIDEE